MAIKKSLVFILVLLFAFVAFACGEEEKKPNGNSGKENEQEKVEDRVMTNHAVYDGVSLPDDLWVAPEVMEDSSKDRKESNLSGEIRGIYYRSDYDGNTSYAFAYLGIPKDVSKDNKAPAVLLIHGGGGTAYYQWVDRWVEKGFVALAMDLEGHEPIETGTVADVPQNLYVSTGYNTPHNQNYGDAALDLEKTWMYYAVSTAIKGNSLLHSLEYVDKNKIGVCGISWGGVITSIISGYDDRFCFAIPIYCSLNLAECKSGNLTSYYKSHPDAKIWDDDEGLSRVGTPMLFLAMDNDISASPDSITYTYQRCKNARITFVPGLLHSHYHAIEREETYEFALSVISGKERLIKIEGKPTPNKGEIKLVIPEGVTIKGAYLRITDSDLSKLPDWQKVRLEVKNNTVSYELTEEIASYLDSEQISYYYVYVEDTLGRITSTGIINI